MLFRSLDLGKGPTSLGLQDGLFDTAVVGDIGGQVCPVRLRLQRLAWCRFHEATKGILDSPLRSVRCRTVSHQTDLFAIKRWQFLPSGEEPAPINVMDHAIGNFESDGVGG